jgi:hypothetical protein
LPGLFTFPRFQTLIAKKLPCSFWQSAQWHATTPALSSGHVHAHAPQWHAPELERSQRS